MKKLFFIAAIAGAALVSCTKNELARVENHDEISFATPVVSTTTKAGTFYDVALFPDDSSFDVFAYYHEGDFAGTGVTYMDNVTVSYSSSVGTTGDAGEGGWLAEGYYWPKNGKLTFDAYAPSTINMTSSLEDGLALANYTVSATCADQIDILFSNRAYNKTNSIGSEVAEYDGVDIQFNHALAVVQVKVAAYNTAAVGNIKITGITVTGVKKTGNFAQGYTNGTGTPAPQWTLDGSTTSYTFGDTEHVLAATTYAGYGEYNILLPQAFVNDGQTIVVNYSIKHGTEWLPQVNSYELYNDGAYYVDGSSNKVIGWDMGKRYTYNISVGLDQVYFAPEVNTWTEVGTTLP